MLGQEANDFFMFFCCFYFCWHLFFFSLYALKLIYTRFTMAAKLGQWVNSAQ